MFGHPVICDPNVSGSSPALHKIILWALNENFTKSTKLLHCIKLIPLAFPLGFHWDSTQTPLGLHWDSTQTPLRLYWDSTQTPLGLHWDYWDSTWTARTPLRLHSDSTGIHLDSKQSDWSPIGQVGDCKVQNGIRPLVMDGPMKYLKWH